ncbi:MAG: hypothetical protein Q7U47_01330 [Paludibacter sp.]|nr:hypothetical protein [Paludibacter sp.]
MKKTSKKFDFKSIAVRVLIPSATGVAVNVVDHALTLDEKTMGYILLGVGAILPEVVKNDMVESASTAMLAIGGYKLSEEFDISSKLGFNAVPKTTGIPGQYNVGQLWAPSTQVRNATAPKKSDNLPSANMQ